MKRIFRSFSMYLVLGPVCGSILVTIGGLAVLFFHEKGIPMPGYFYFFITAPYVAFIGCFVAFAYGGCQAGFVGLVTGVVEFFLQRSAPWWVPALAAFVSWIVFTTVYLPRNPGILPDTSALIWFFIHIGSALLVWWYVQRLRHRHGSPLVQAALP